MENAASPAAGAALLSKWPCTHARSRSGQPALRTPVRRRGTQFTSPTTQRCTLTWWRTGGRGRQPRVAAPPWARAWSSSSPVAADSFARAPPPESRSRSARRSHSALALASAAAQKHVPGCLVCEVEWAPESGVVSVERANIASRRGIPTSTTEGTGGGGGSGRIRAPSAPD